MSGDYCSLWRTFVATPDDAAVAARLRSEHTAVLEHVDGCSACLELAAEADPARLFDALGALEGPLSAQDQDILSAMLTAVSTDRDAIVSAVNDALLPALPPHLADLSRVGSDVQPHTLFLSLDAVRLLLKSMLRRRVPTATRLLAMDATGNVILNGDMLVAADTVAGEIADYAEIAPRSAQNLVQWIPDAAWYQPHLIPGFAAEPRIELARGVWLKPMTWDARSNLFQHWAAAAVADPA
jgi:hypothetical protein